MNVNRVAITAGVLGLVSGALVACSPISQNNRAAIQGNRSNQAPKLGSVAVTVGDLGNPFFVLMGRGAEAEAKKIGGNDVKVTVVSSGYDLNQQFNQMENFIAAGTDVIILNAGDSKGIAPAVEKAKLAGSVVIAVDTGAEGGVDATITSNNVQAGQVGCQYIVDRLKGKGNIVIINGPPVISVVERVNGCQQIFAKYPGIKVLSKDQNAEGSRDGGLRVMSDLLATFPKIDAVFAINDPTGVGAELAARQAKRSEFFIVGVDGAPEAKDAIADKNSLFVATAAQDPLGMTKKAVQVGNDILYGKKPANPNILIPVKLITRDNVSEYKGWQ
ncbi:periplasmic binding protein/LacI transcriptional regulator [Scytonema sp. HK-05]|uniref:ABC transporter substrate-binding protein n=1 Tax=Scytonema sp. HK-05 TaxID=1137095 RepID=UPI000935DEE7|nr:ABC transporter substrate-binding protein [Scytonema sp. HK-05]OKH60112.1 transcriptional regulator [Scytonema sp. HK-05]BAY42932.1 periplasmic binding protein/LacI transcriptional regulator [Scytonema sp. HK-05]